MDEPVSMVPSSHEQSVLNEVKSKQSQFFNSLFPSRANRFGFPVYPERTFGIPSNMSVPVSFAGFSPGNIAIVFFFAMFCFISFELSFQNLVVLNNINQCSISTVVKELNLVNHHRFYPNFPNCLWVVKRSIM